MNDPNASLIQNAALIAAAVAVVGLGMAVINYARREVKGQARAEEDLLAQFQAAYDAGEMDSGEFRRVSESIRRRRREGPIPEGPPRMSVEERGLDPKPAEPMPPDEEPSPTLPGPPPSTE